MFIRPIELAATAGAKDVQAGREALVRRLNALGNLRLLSAVLALIFLALAYGLRQLLLLLPALAALAAFVVVYRRHRALDAQRRYYEARLTLLAEREARRGDDWRQFNARGDALLESASADARALAQDLDLFGPASLYQRLSVVVSPQGERRLAELLLAAPPPLAEIRARQDAVATLREAADERADLLTRLIEAREEGLVDAIRFERLAGQHEPTLRPLPAPLRILLPGLVIASLLVLLLASLDVPVPPPIVQMAALSAIGLAALQLVVSLVRRNHITPFAERLIGLGRGSTPYAALLTAMARPALERSPRLAELAALARPFAHAEGGKALHQLSRLARRAEGRRNILGWLLQGALGLGDEQLLAHMLAWRARWAQPLIQAAWGLGEIEALLSLAEGFEAYDGCLPDLEGGANSDYLLVAGRHPLLSVEEAVANDVALSPGCVIVTGSNMSGKSTWLRTLGLNQILANAGAPVAAASALLPQRRVLSSIRIHDRLEAGISAFYAEVLRIRSMVEAAEDGEPLLLLIDEIFHGTNAADRIAGARAVLRRLARPWLLTLVTTHDAELCALADDEAVHATNVHFAEAYDGDRLIFDYRLREGPSRGSSARELLRLAAIETDETTDDREVSTR